jgi:hypothetical protein
MPNRLLYYIDAEVIALLLFIALIAALEVGYRLVVRHTSFEG